MFKFADFHCDTLQNICLGQDFSSSNQTGHLDLPRLLAANYIFQCFAAFFDPALGQEAALRQTLRLLNTAGESIFSLPGVRWVKAAGDIQAAKDGELMALLSIEGADFIGTDLFLLELVHNMGVRLITLTWNGRNSLGDGVRAGSGGLSNIGYKAVKAMEDLSIIVDVSHLAEMGFWDVCSAANKPFVASHSNAWTICPHPRNLKDEQIREISRAGGLIGMNLCPPFIAEDREGQSLPALVRHMSHIAAVGSVDILCLGADLDGIEELPQEMEDVRDIAKLPGLMEAAGFSPKEIQAVCAGNLLRFLQENLE